VLFYKFVSLKLRHFIHKIKIINIARMVLKSMQIHSWCWAHFDTCFSTIEPRFSSNDSCWMSRRQLFHLD